MNSSWNRKGMRDASASARHNVKSGRRSDWSKKPRQKAGAVRAVNPRDYVPQQQYMPIYNR